MNRYDQLPTWAKYLHEVLCVAPAIVASGLTSSWKTGMMALVLG